MKEVGKAAALFVGAIIGSLVLLTAFWLAMQIYPPQSPDVQHAVTLSAPCAGALFGAVLVLILRRPAEGSVEPPRDTAVREYDEVDQPAAGNAPAERLREIAIYYRERTRYYKKHFIEAATDLQVERRVRIRYGFWRSVLLCALGFGACYPLTGILSGVVVFVYANGGVGQTTLPPALDYSQSVLLFIAAMIVPCWVLRSARKRSGAVAGIGAAATLGAVGVLLPGVVFFSQFTPELLVFLNDAGPEAIPVLPVLPWEVPYVLQLLCVRLVLFPVTGMLAAMGAHVVLTGRPRGSAPAAMTPAAA